MKRVFAFFALAVLMHALSQPIVAQERGVLQVRVGAGWLSLPDFIGGLVVGLGSIDTTEGVEGYSFAPMINPNVELLCGVNEWLALGGSLSVGCAAAETRFEQTGEVSKSTSALYPTICLAATTRYFSSGRVTIYGSWGVGAMMLLSRQTLSSETNTQVGVAPMANLYPLCLSWGGSARGFVELGWGAKGIVNVGGFFRF